MPSHLSKISTIFLYFSLFRSEEESIVGTEFPIQLRYYTYCTFESFYIHPTTYSFHHRIRAVPYKINRSKTDGKQIDRSVLRTRNDPFQVLAGEGCTVLRNRREKVAETDARLTGSSGRGKANDDCDMVSALDRRVPR